MVEESHSATDSVIASEVEHHEPQLTKRERRLGCLYSGLAFFAGYVISAGPAAFMTNTFDQPMFNRIAETIYFPLILIIKMDVPVVSPLINAWVGLFT